LSETTVIGKATSKSDSLRTTVPASVVRQFKIKEGDGLEWNMTVRGGKLIIELRHIKQGRIEVEEKKKPRKSKGPIQAKISKT
jgi:bifunctional DNA-binding transcriptional regulator/antitoxin component of YhaV-PrlF toxin-antitoxin module